MKKAVLFFTAVCLTVFVTVIEPDDDDDYQTHSASYILNKNTKKFHLPSCYSVDQMKESNNEYYTGDIDDLIGRGYSRFKNCNP